MALDPSGQGEAPARTLSHAAASALLGAAWGAACVLAYYGVFLQGLRAILGPGTLTGTFVALQTMLSLLVSMVLYAWRGPPAGVGGLATGLVPLVLYAADRAGTVDLPF